MGDRDKLALLSVLGLEGEAEVRRRYEAGQFRKRRLQAELPVIEEWLAAWRWRKKACLN